MALHDPPLEIPFINLETGFVTEPWAKWLIITKTDKANIIEGGTEDNVVTIDSTGNPKDSGSQLVSGGIADWVAGTTNQITVTDDGDGTITLSLEQDIATSSSPTFSGITIVNNANLILEQQVFS